MYASPFLARLVRFHFFLILAFSSSTAFSQSSTTLLSDSIGAKSEGRLGIRYSSDYIYMGRADSAEAPYLSPYFGYYHKSGFFASTSISYLTNPEESRIDVIRVSGGYDYYGKKFTAGGDISQYFYSDYSYVVASEMSTYLNANAGYDFDIFMLYLDAGIGISDGADFNISPELNRTFYLLKRKLRLVPAISMNAGTQLYYDEYHNLRNNQTGAGQGQGNVGGMQPQQTQSVSVQESNKFNILDYELNLQTIYKLNKFRFYLSFTYAFPVNPATIETDTGIYTETLNNKFFWSGGIRFYIY